MYVLDLILEERYFSSLRSSQLRVEIENEIKLKHHDIKTLLSSYISPLSRLLLWLLMINLNLDDLFVTNQGRRRSSNSSGSQSTGLGPVIILRDLGTHTTSDNNDN